MGVKQVGWGLPGSGWGLVDARSSTLSDSFDFTLL